MGARLSVKKAICSVNCPVGCLTYGVVDQVVAEIPGGMEIGTSKSVPKRGFQFQ